MRLRHDVGAVRPAIVKAHGQRAAAGDLGVVGDHPLGGGVDEKRRGGHDSQLDAPGGGPIRIVQHAAPGIVRDLHGHDELALAGFDRRAGERLAIAIAEPGTLTTGAGQHDSGDPKVDMVSHHALHGGNVDAAISRERSRGG